MSDPKPPTERDFELIEVALESAIRAVAPTFRDAVEDDARLAKEYRHALKSVRDWQRTSRDG